MKDELVKLIILQKEEITNQLDLSKNPTAENAVKLSNTQKAINKVLDALDKESKALDILKEALSNIHIGIDKGSKDGDACVIGLYNPEVDRMYILFESTNSEIVKKAEQLKEWFNKDKSE